MSDEVSAREDGMHAGKRQGGGLIDTPDRRVRVRAAHKRGVQQPGQPDVVDEAAFAFQQRLVLEPRHGAADDSHARKRFAASKCWR